MTAATWRHRVVAGRDHGEQRLEQSQRLPMVLSGFGPAQGLAERLDSPRRRRVGRLHHVAGRGTVAAGFDQHPAPRGDEATGGAPR